MKDIIKNILKESYFEWVKNVEPDYWSPEHRPLNVGDCIVDKLDFSSTQWVIEKLSQTLSGTKTIIVSDGEETKILNRESFEKDLVKGRYSFCDDFIKEDFDWIESIDPSDYLVGKCFFFDPPVETDNDSDYGKLFDYLIDNGFEPFYGTERNAYDVVGLYSYIERGSGKKGFVFTELENDTDTPENYLQHIKDFANDESESGREGIVLLYARDYVRTNIN